MRRSIAAFALLADPVPAFPGRRYLWRRRWRRHGRRVSPGGMDEAEVYRVPWKVLDPKAMPAPGPSGLAVLWFPLSREAARASQLLESRYLTVSIAPCSGFWIVPSDATALRVRYGAVDGNELALLVDADGVELARALPEKGQLRVNAVEKMVRGDLDKRREVAEARLAEAQAKEKKGDAEAAAGLYQELYAQRCLFPVRPARRRRR